MEAPTQDSDPRLPNGRVLMQILGLSPETLRVLERVPVPSATLHALIGALAARERFDAAFYAETYPDLAEARDSGVIADLRTHFLQFGYIEGRLGAPPEVDEEFYAHEYPDVRDAIAAGDFASAYDHYVRSGAREGRYPNQREREARESWRRLLLR